ncbi:MAG: hypothetical protein ACI30J_02290 [Paludibacteraceae bacterium]
MHDNSIADQCGRYIVPSLDGVTPGATDACSDTHYHFVGWVTRDISSGEATEPEDLLRAGETKDAEGKTYRAVWAKAKP